MIEIKYYLRSTILAKVILDILVQFIYIVMISCGNLVYLDFKQYKKYWSESYKLKLKYNFIFQTVLMGLRRIPATCVEKS